MDAWICGLRRDQSVTRQKISIVEWDDIQKKIKVNPLADWGLEQVWDYIHEHKIPHNTLHDKGFPSIGCLPCTRAVLQGEDIRAGRWWWESPENRECGLHQK
jgi:phosphoadenosine phosphosulfate reductase